MPETPAQPGTPDPPETPDHPEASTQPDPPTPPKHDAAYKSFFARRRVVEDTLRVLDVVTGTADIATGTGDAAKRDPVRSGLARRLDFATLERMPASFVTEHLGRRHADMLWRIRTRDETWLHLLVLFEFQSTVDRRMAIRMMNYAGGLWMGLESDHLGPGGELPFVLPIVIYNGRRRWTAPEDVRDLLAPAPPGPLGSRPRHPYLVIELRRLDLSQLPDDNVFSKIVALERARSEKRIAELTVSVLDWADRVGEPELKAAFTVWIVQVLAQRRDSEGRTREHEIEKLLEVPMTMLSEWARAWGDARNQEWLEKGLERGLERGRSEGRAEGRSEGRAEGRSEGRAEGRLQGERQLVQRQVARRFGRKVADELRPVLDALSDPKSLEAIGDAVVECRTAEGFRGRVEQVAGR